MCPDLLPEMFVFNVVSVEERHNSLQCALSTRLVRNVVHKLVLRARLGAAT